MTPVNTDFVPTHLAHRDGISAEKVAKLCFDKYKLLPKTGKPTNNEWTVLAGVVMHNSQTGMSQVVCLGSGTKCIGQSKLCPQGLILNDSHGEVMARRGLMRYMYHQLNEAISEKGSIFEWVPDLKKFQIRTELSFHFLSTQTPCGDACIIPSNESQQFVEEPSAKKSKMTDVTINNAHVGSIIDCVYTGAKLIGSHHSDAMEQLVGAVRTKPGRGERTLSMSCSDKLAKWQIMGVQGALLDFLIVKPIYFDSLNFWGANDLGSLERAIWKRFEYNKFDHFKYNLKQPNIRICNQPDFPHAQCNIKQPSPNSSVWCDISDNMKPYEISINGKRQGITTKKLQSPESALKVSKCFLLKDFINVIKLKPQLIPYEEMLEKKTYFECKFLAKDYQTAWSDIKKCYFKQWSQKPESLLNFCIEVRNKDGKE